MKGNLSLVQFEPRSLHDQLKKTYNLREFNPQTGCVMPSRAVSKEMKEAIEEVPQSPFKALLYAHCGCYDAGDAPDADVLLDEFFDDSTPTPVSVAFYLVYKSLTQALSQMDKLRMKKAAASVIQMTTDEQRSDPEALCARAVAAGWLIGAGEAGPACVGILEETVRYLGSEEVKMDQTALKNSGLFAFPVEIFHLLLSRLYSAEGRLDDAVETLTKLGGFQAEAAELLFAAGGAQRASEVLRHEIRKVLPQDVSFLEKDARPFPALLECDFEAAVPWAGRGAEFARLRPAFQEICLLGEVENNPQLIALAAACDPKKARPYRDLGAYFVAEFKQEGLDQAQQVRCIKNAAYLLNVAQKLDPADRACRENLCALLLLTKQQLPYCRAMYQQLSVEFGENKDYAQGIALTYYAEKNLKAALDFYLKAMKLNYQAWDVTLVYQVLQLLVDIKEQHDELRAGDAIYVLEQQLVVFYQHLQFRQWDDARQEKITYVMNFLWHATPFIRKLFHWLCDQRDRKMQWDNAKRVFTQWLKLASDHAGTVAGDEVLGAYLELYKRFENK